MEIFPLFSADEMLFYGDIGVCAGDDSQEGIPSFPVFEVFEGVEDTFVQQYSGTYPDAKEQPIYELLPDIPQYNHGEYASQGPPSSADGYERPTSRSDGYEKLSNNVGGRNESEGYIKLLASPTAYSATTYSPPFQFENLNISSTAMDFFKKCPKAIRIDEFWKYFEKGKAQKFRNYEEEFKVIPFA